MEGLSASHGGRPQHQRHVPGEAGERKPPHAGLVRPEARPGGLDRDPEEGGRLCQLLPELGNVQGL